MPTSSDESSNPALNLSKWWLDRLGCVKYFGFKAFYRHQLKDFALSMVSMHDLFLSRGMLHDCQNSFFIVNDEFACLKLSVALSVVQPPY